MPFVRRSSGFVACRSGAIVRSSHGPVALTVKRRANVDVRARDRVAHRRADDAVAVAQIAVASRVVQDERAVLGGVDDVLDHQPLDERDLRVVEPPRAVQAVGFERRLGRERLVAVEPLPLGQALVERQRVVQLHADAQLELVPEAGPVQRHQEGQREHEVRRDAEEDLALAHVAAHEREVEQLEVAKSAVDQACRSRGRPRGEVVLLDERDREAAQGRVARDPRSDDPAADDQEIDGAAAERPHRLFSCDYVTGSPCCTCRSPRSSPPLRSRGRLGSFPCPAGPTRSSC